MEVSLPSSLSLLGCAHPKQPHINCCGAFISSWHLRVLRSFPTFRLRTVDSTVRHGLTSIASFVVLAGCLRGILFFLSRQGIV